MKTNTGRVLATLAAAILAALAFVAWRTRHVEPSSMSTETRVVRRDLPPFDPAKARTTATQTAFAAP